MMADVEKSSETDSNLKECAKSESINGHSPDSMKGKSHLQDKELENGDTEGSLKEESHLQVNGELSEKPQNSNQSECTFKESKPDKAVNCDNKEQNEVSDNNKNCDSQPATNNIKSDEENVCDKVEKSGNDSNKVDTNEVSKDGKDTETEKESNEIKGKEEESNNSPTKESSEATENEKSDSPSDASASTQQEKSKCKDASTSDDDVEIIPEEGTKQRKSSSPPPKELSKEAEDDDESDIEMIEESDPLAFSDADVKKANEAKKDVKKDPNVIVIDTNTLIKNQGNLPASVNSLSRTRSQTAKAAAASAPSTPSVVSVSTPVPVTTSATINTSSVLTNATSTTTTSANIQTAIQAIATNVGGGSSAIQGLQTAYLSVIQQTLLAQNSGQVSNPQYLTQLQHYYNTLTSLQDDAYVIEAPSFIVPYVMEGKPKETIKDFLTQLNKDLEELQKKKKEEEEKKKQEEEKKKKEEEEEKNKQEEENKDSEDEKEQIVEETDKKDESDKMDKENSEKMDVDEDSTKEKTTDDSKDKEAPAANQTKDDHKGNSASKDDDKENEDEEVTIEKEVTKPDYSHLGRWETYYNSALGKFFLDLGLSHTQEFIQSDLLRMQKRRLEKLKSNPSRQDMAAVKTLELQLNQTKEKNKHLRIELRTCKFCSFKTESKLVMDRHLESPHMVNYTYKCNFCEFETRGPQVILFHMEAEHNVRGRLERAPAFFQCPLCPYEDNNKSKMTRHSFSCSKKFRPEKNLDLADWEPPAKIPKLHRGRAVSGHLKTFDQLSRMPSILPKGLTNINLSLQNAISSGLIASPLQNSASANSLAGRGRGRPIGSYKNIAPTLSNRNNTPILYPNRVGSSAGYLHTIPGVSTAQQLSIANQMLQSVQNRSGTTKSPQQPSISITPLPRTGAPATAGKSTISTSNLRDGSSSRPPFVICEVCDGYIKDLEQLRNHMNLIHKVKIHPKMIYNRPPLNCQKCQQRFFTDQGLERHLLGTHGLVTSSMQEAANKGKDAGRCPICGKVFQWKLLNHVNRDHKMTLKPAHLSYKCTVCTATFNMYRLFENHVYSAHSVVKNKDGAASGQSSSNSSSSAVANTAPATAKKTVNDAPLKINDEITIIPQPASKSVKADSKGSSATSSSSPQKKSESPSVSKEITITKVGSRSSRRSTNSGNGGVEVISLDDSPSKRPAEEPPKKRGRETLTSKRARTST